jgi:hypothetical protein
MISFQRVKPVFSLVSIEYRVYHVYLHYKHRMDQTLGKPGQYYPGGRRGAAPLSIGARMAKLELQVPIIPYLL